jgi:hypothetical protein
MQDDIIDIHFWLKGLNFFLNLAEEGEIKMEFPHGAENEAAPAKRERADDGEVATAAKRRRGFGAGDDAGSDRKKSREQGEWADTSRSERSPGPVEEGELPSANEGEWFVNFCKRSNVAYFTHAFSFESTSHFTKLTTCNGALMDTMWNHDMEVAHKV